MTDLATVIGWAVLGLGAILAAVAVLALFAWALVTLSDEIIKRSKLLYVVSVFLWEWYRRPAHQRAETMERSLRMVRRRDDRGRGICPDCGLTLEPVCTFCEMNHDVEPDHA